MLKNIFGVLVGIIWCHALIAQNKTDTVKFYYKKSGAVVQNPDSADFLRVILPPDSLVDKDLYRVFDYYIDGKRKSVATSFTNTARLTFDGIFTSYYKNGKRQSVSQFKNGRRIGIITNYYPNGKLYEILKVEDLTSTFYNTWYYDTYFLGRYPDSYNYKVVELRDSTGKVLASTGTGHILSMDDDGKILIEGDLKNDKKEGVWHGILADTVTYDCHFHKNVFESGESITKSGKRYTFKVFHSEPVYSDGMIAFYDFILKNLKYPEAAAERRLSGAVLIGFYVETDGTLSNVAVKNGVFKSLDDEALRVVKLSPLWYPATYFGVPIRQYFQVYVDFNRLKTKGPLFKSM